MQALDLRSGMLDRDLQVSRMQGRTEAASTRE